MGNVHSAYTEHGYDHDALSETHVQLDELGDGDHEDADVEDDVDDGVRPYERVQIDAFASVLAVPGLPNVCDWQTVNAYDDGEDKSLETDYT